MRSSAVNTGADACHEHTEMRFSDNDDNDDDGFSDDGSWDKCGGEDVCLDDEPGLNSDVPGCELEGAMAESSEICLDDEYACVECDSELPAPVWRQVSLEGSLVRAQSMACNVKAMFEKSFMFQKYSCQVPHCSAAFISPAELFAHLAHRHDVQVAGLDKSPPTTISREHLSRLEALDQCCGAAAGCAAAVVVPGSCCAVAMGAAGRALSKASAGAPVKYGMVRSGTPCSSPCAAKQHGDDAERENDAMRREMVL